MREHGGQVHLEDRRDVRSSVQQTFDHPLGDSLAHRRVRHASALCGRLWRSWLFTRARRRGSLLLGYMLEYVVDSDASTSATAANLASVHLVLRQQPAHGRTIATAG
jgi:hypothetical protein